MDRGERLYEGKAKELFATDREGILLLAYKDSVTAFNGEKKDTMPGKGRLTNEISALLFRRLAEAGIASHFIEKISETEQLVRKVRIIPLEVVVRNVTAGSLAKRLGLAEGRHLAEPVVEFYYKNDDLGDPLLTVDHVLLLGLADERRIAELRERALEVNRVLRSVFAGIGITLVDFKLEFGLAGDELVLADEISPDTCRLWDSGGEKLDKDVYRRGLGDMLPGYRTVLERLSGVASGR
ncbi:MAG: phosphoribosylaminoimidazolesuccinocarboxamide synthase [Treponema sp.]|nr:phosphoribosylaminoimidazolesuccinocarboxamide synthase [Treponema sp.]